MGLINAAIKNKKIVLFLVFIAILGGLACYHYIPKQGSPDVSSPTAMITTIYPGASPKDVESLVTKKIEDKIEEIDGYDYADDIKKQLGNVSGISRFYIKGKQDKQVKVEVDLNKINKYSISLEEVCGVLQAQNLEIPSRSLELKTGKIKVQTPGSFTSLKDIENTIVGVSSDAGQTLKLKDIATVKMDYDDDSAYKFTDNGEKAVLLAGYFQDNKNIVLIADDVRKKLEEIKKQLPQDLKIDEVTFQPKDVDNSVSFFMKNLEEGVILVVITVLIGMEIRNALVVSSVIPISIALSFITMEILGIKVHQISTTALIIALGISVDDAIVIGDVVQVGIDEGLSGDEAAFKGIKKLFVPVFTFTLIIVGAFVPLLSIPGAVGEFIRTLPQVVMICITCSYISALFITPAMSSLFFKKSKVSEKMKKLKILIALRT